MDSILGDLSTVSTERLEAALGAGAARIAALQCKWLLLLAEFVERRGFERWGMSAQHWLSWRCALDPVTAREHLRVARCLARMPAIREAFATGSVSYSKVRAITRVATEEDEQDWVATAVALPAAKLTRLTGRCKTITTQEERAPSKQQSLAWSHDDNGMLVVVVRLTPEAGAEFVAAIERQQAVGHPQPVDSAEATGQGEPVDALLELVHGATEPVEPGLVSATQPEVVLHVTAGDLGAERPSRRHLSNDKAVGPAAARRLACDPILTALLHAGDGRVIDVGRRHRLVTQRLRRAVYERDMNCCAFPGCANSRWLDVHHIVHWEDGGHTDLDNLLLLCGTHHRAHHADTFSIHLVDGSPRFERPDGVVIEPAPRLRALPSPPDDLLAVNEGGLGPIEGSWDGSEVDHEWAVNSFVTNARHRLRVPC